MVPTYRASEFATFDFTTANYFDATSANGQKTFLFELKNYVVEMSKSDMSHTGDDS